jgi:hypothetical protein
MCTLCSLTQAGRTQLLLPALLFSQSLCSAICIQLLAASSAFLCACYMTSTHIDLILLRWFLTLSLSRTQVVCIKLLVAYSAFLSITFLLLVASSAFLYHFLAPGFSLNDFFSLMQAMYIQLLVACSAFLSVLLYGIDPYRFNASAGERGPLFNMLFFFKW